MPLQRPSRLPTRLNRTANPYARSLARRQYARPAGREKTGRGRMKRYRRHWFGLSLSLWRELKLWLAIIFLVVLTGAIIVFLFSPAFNVKQIHVRRQDSRIDAEEVQQILSPLFHERLLFVTKKEVISFLQDSYPDITDVTIAKTYPSTLTVSIFTDPIVAELSILDETMASSGSGGVISPDSSSGSYAYVTAKGFSIISPIRLSGSPLPRLTVTDWGIRPANRTRLLSPEMLRAVLLARTTLRESFGLIASDVIIYLRAQEFHVTTKKATLWFDLASPLAVQFGRFREFLKMQSLDTVKNYVDLRISDRVIYK